VLIPAAFVFLLPFLWMVSTSLKQPSEALVPPPVWFPNPIAWVNYPNAVNYIPFFVYLRNTLAISILAMIGAVFSASLVAYSLARIQWPGRHILLLVTIATLMLPYQVTLVPLFLVYKNLGWIGADSPGGGMLPLIVPHFFANAYNVFLLRQYFLTLPQEIFDAARIDGAGPWTILWRIVVPNVRPAIAVVTILAFLAAWNQYIWPLLILNQLDPKTLAVGMQFFARNSDSTQLWGAMMATATLATIPPLVLYALAQKRIISTFVTSGIKG